LAGIPDIEDLFESVRKRNPEISDFDAACFNQHYVTGTVSDDYLMKQGLSRADKEKTNTGLGQTVIELHNNH